MTGPFGENVLGHFGVVAIARNEGERFRRCLDALRERAGGATLVYVDSGSTDGSVELARGRGVEVVALDLSIPFTAARARNAGFERLIAIDPDVEFVQFLDGDCEVAQGWLEAAGKTLEAKPAAAVAFGHTRERFPEHSVYNRLADMEWKTIVDQGGPGGEAEWCGGNAAFRAVAFREAGGFNPSVPAGEEPELCQRLRSAGWKVIAVNADMAWHDTAMFKFSQWAKRESRTGYGGLDFSTRFGKPGDDPFKRQIVSARFWVIVWPLAVVAAVLPGAFAFGTPGALVFGVPVALAPIAQTLRIAARHRRPLKSPRLALAYGALTILAKWPQMYGQWLYLRDRKSGRHARVIEYKAIEVKIPAGEPSKAGSGFTANRYDL